MSYNNYEYPYFDACNYNSDWLINKMKELEETVIGLETFKYIGENEILDLNQQKQNSIAAFTSNFNVLNSPVSNVQRVTVTYGSETAYIQQLYDLSNFTVYTRNYSTASGWTAWKMTQNKAGTNLHTTPMLTSGNLNDMSPNSATIVNGNSVQNAPTHYWGFVITWNADGGADKIQLWFDMNNSFCYIRYAKPGWQPWLELNHIDLTDYLKGINVISTSTSLSNVAMNRTARIMPGTPSNPASVPSQFLTLGSPNDPNVFQAVFEGSTGKIWIRPDAASGWKNVTDNYRVLHRLTDSAVIEDYYGAVFGTSNFNNALLHYSAVIGMGYDSFNSDTYQIGMTSNNKIFSRFRNGQYWGDITFYQQVANTRSLTITSTAEDHSTDDEGRDRYMMGDNIYTEAANTMYNTYISLPGQSLLHSDEGKQSFKDAILAADLSDIDVVMTNLEMWDMDIALDTIVEEVQSLAEAITAKNPMCELTLLSIPPIDIPLWGDELLDCTMPNGSKIRQLDDRLFRLSEDNAFTYIPFEYFYDAQNANLLEYLGDDLKTNKQYLRRVGSFIKNTM